MLPKVPEASDPNDLLLNFLRDDGAEKRSLARARRMMEWYAAGTAALIDDGPSIEEVCTGTHTSIADATTNEFVGPASHCRRGSRKSQRARLTRLISEFPYEASNITVTFHSGRIKTRRHVRTSGEFEILLINSSGRPQLAPALRGCNKQVKVVVN